MQRDLVELRLRIGRQVGASGKVLSQPQIGVFVGAALPGTLRIAEVALDVRGCREGLVARPISCNDRPAFQQRQITLLGVGESLARFPSLINTVFEPKDLQMVLHPPIASTKRKRASRHGGGSTMRAALTGRWARGPRTNSPRESRLATIPLVHQQPKTRLSLGPKNQDPSSCGGEVPMTGPRRWGRLQRAKSRAGSRERH